MLEVAYIYLIDISEASIIITVGAVVVTFNALHVI